ncbi:MAG TPA: efflux transporter outer membrane subunit [Bacteroides sp.]|nr:efflux transporter outer membrane subunit [Bacteroides sp.]
MKISMKRILIYIPVLILAVNGCMVGPNLEKPEVVSPEEYRFVSTPQDSLEDLAWWELFGDEYLNNLIDTALKHNPSAKIAASRILEAEAILGFNRADIYPRFGYDGSATRQKPNPQMQGTDPGNLFAFGANVFWEMDFWGKYRRATQAARAELIASEYGYQTVQLSLISGVADLYFQLLGLQASLEISERTWETRKVALEIIQERYNKGIIPELDLNQAQIQEAIAAGAIPFYERLVSQTENALSTLVGLNPRAVEYGPLRELIESPDIPAGLPSELLERRPDVLAAEQLFYAQTARIGVAQAMRFPSISLTAGLGAVSTDLSSFSAGSNLAWSLGGGIVGPIFNFGKNKRRVEVEHQRAEQSLFAYEETVLQAFREVEDALIEIETLNRELEAVNRRVIAAVNAATLSEARYNGGQTSYLEVLESDRQMFNAELAAAETYQLHLNSYVKLYKALGGGWATDVERQQAQQDNASAQ